MNQKSAIQTKKMDKPDRIRAYLMGEIKSLKKSEHKFLSRIKKIEALCERRYTKANIIKIISSKDFFEMDEALSERQSYNLYNDAQKIFGNVQKFNKDAERYFSHERYLKLAKIAEDAGDYLAAGQLQEKADKLYSLFEPETGSKNTGLFFQNVKVTVVRTSNPNALIQTQSIELDPENDFLGQIDEEY
jgi:hypothetical protein